MARKPFINPLTRKLRLNFAKRYVDKDKTFWENIIFADESAFELFVTKKGQWTWRRPNERFKAEHIVPTKKFGGGKIHIWGCMTASEIGWMCNLPQGLDGPTYVSIMEDELLKTAKLYFKKKNNFAILQDRAPVHNSRVVRNWMKRNQVQLIPWPTNSPDLNPIENLWADVKKRVAQNHINIYSRDQLWEAIQVEYENTPRDYCKTLADSMPARLAEVIKAKGYHTKY